jgi:indole-3-glycerol phosphate synthase
MSGFLACMAEASAARVRRAAAREALADLRRRAADAPPAPPLRLAHAFELIAEYKRQSPSLGRLASGEDRLSNRVEAFARGGAAAVSVLTEPDRFAGSLVHLAEAAAVLAPLGVPVMRKDFLVDPYQLYEARAAGAGGVLLIVRMLLQRQLREMMDCAAELGLFVLLEASDADDVEAAVTAVQRASALDRGARHLLGVNCRDLETLEVNSLRHQELAPLLPDGLPRVAESGITMPDQCVAVARAGYGIALVGGSLMHEADPQTLVRAMLAAGRMAAKAAA